MNAPEREIAPPHATEAAVVRGGAAPLPRSDLQLNEAVGFLVENDRQVVRLMHAQPYLSALRLSPAPLHPHANLAVNRFDNKVGAIGVGELLTHNSLLLGRGRSPQPQDHFTAAVKTGFAYWTHQ